MTDLTEARMIEPMEEDSSSGRSLLWIILSSLGVVMTIGAVAGYLAEHHAQGSGPLGSTGIIVLGISAAIIAGLCFVIWRNVRKLKLSRQPTTRREKLNRNIMLACLLLGAAIVVVLEVAGTLDATDAAKSPFSMFVDAPMPNTVALILVFIWAVVMPVVAWFWHTRAIDEQEASAYRDGGYYAAYSYLILAPAWWLLWRGGLLPEPDGVAIYVAFSLIWSAIWIWKKYR